MTRSLNFFFFPGNYCSVPFLNTLQYYITSHLSGDTMKKLAPFLKLYTEYVKNFDSAMNIISAVAAKYPRFMAIMDEIHVSQWLCLVLQTCNFLGLLGQLLVRVSNYVPVSDTFYCNGHRSC